MGKPGKPCVGVRVRGDTTFVSFRALVSGKLQTVDNLAIVDCTPEQLRAVLPERLDTLRAKYQSPRRQADGSSG